MVSLTTPLLPSKIKCAVNKAVVKAVCLIFSFLLLLQAINKIEVKTCYLEEENTIFQFA
jgi:multidrug transporter EmrE-like cation transporter